MKDIKPPRISEYGAGGGMKANPNVREGFISEDIRIYKPTNEG